MSTSNKLAGEPFLLDFEAVIRREGGLFVAECAQLGIVTNGECVEEAEKRIQEAIIGTLEFAIKRGKIQQLLQRTHLPVPPASGPFFVTIDVKYKNRKPASRVEMEGAAAA